MYSVALSFDRLDPMLMWCISDLQMMITDDEAVDFVPDLARQAEKWGDN